MTERLTFHYLKQFYLLPQSMPAVGLLGETWGTSVGKGLVGMHCGLVETWL